MSNYNWNNNLKICIHPIQDIKVIWQIATVEMDKPDEFIVIQ